MSHILITGASSGIGAALVKQYAAPNIRLSLHGRSAERLKEVAKIAEGQGAKVVIMAGDVTDAKPLTEWITQVDQVEPLSLVIANAGISGGTSGFSGDQKQMEQIFAVNWQGVLNTVSHVALLMAERGRGQIALMSSLAAFRGYAGSGAYAASKAAVRIYGEALRADLKPYGVTVNVICPGFIKTPMTDVNGFSMPFLMNVEDAARIIQKGLRQNRPVIAFPWPMYWLVRFMAFLPLDFVIGLMAGRAKKPPLRG